MKKSTWLGPTMPIDVVRELTLNKTFKLKHDKVSNESSYCFLSVGNIHVTNVLYILGLQKTVHTCTCVYGVV